MTCDTKLSSKIMPPTLFVAALSAAVGCMSIAALLALYTHGRRTTSVDLLIDRLMRSKVEDPPEHLTALVSVLPPLAMLALGAGLSLVALALAQRRSAALCLAGPALALLATKVAKELLGRPSATIVGSYDAYPSGHMAGAAGLATVVLVLTLRESPLGARLRPWTTQVLRTGVAVFLLSLAVALTAERDHYITDVIGGAALAIGVVLLTALVLDALNPDAPRE